ncbi:GHKL domain-containing protein [Pseudoalteromonas sp. NEC-BIFX-2020_015]|uniref:sensor histidine kinase n=1 Tax=Pseudoalteromonas sp. NEC-BIFX-2020_015 TaxID=2729544 RepID=UPI0014614CA8|nr:ATP-binding protein [Pseudoalteromonas sp. NEC-BIFX-2020_015]NMR26110.1 GHKL domain-containing protein [Pseudoalteromonas sp. NEC-BIFX-2020_015]
MTMDIDYKQAYLREQSARLQAEQLIEDKSRVLFALNEELEKKVAALEHQQALLVHAEKMATLGTLSAGVAHEINNPLAYAMSNLESLQYINQSVFKLLELSQKLAQGEVSEREFREFLINMNEIHAFDVINQDIVELIDDSVEGLRRINQIVRNLLNFARPSDNEKILVDMTDGVNNALKLLKSQLKGVEVITKFQPIPLTYCNLSAINQIVVNLLINAKHACENLMQKKGRIYIEVKFSDPHIIIGVEDNGCGMSEEVKGRIFDPFFTTKSVGKGTGMGMPLVYSMVSDHQGAIDISSHANQGTNVRCLFPVINNCF